MKQFAGWLFGCSLLVACGQEFSSGQKLATTLPQSSTGGAGGVTTGGFGGGNGGYAGASNTGGSGGFGGNTTTGTGGQGGATTTTADAGVEGGVDGGVCTCTLDHATSSCVNGDCSIVKCDQGYADCDGDPMTGCEISTKVDANNCDTCNKICGAWPNGAPACVNGVCGVLCSPGYANCNKAIGDGCEINLKSDPLNCGACQSVCSIPHGMSGCTDGSCSVAGCDPHRGDCNGIADDGCEVTLKNDPTHCGTCQNACSIANGTPGCTNGNCSVASCDVGYDDCNDLVSDGCEVDLKSDPAHCGTCESVCSVANGVAGCTNSGCSVANCDVNRADCNGLVADGCESSTQTDMSNCGKCGTVCGANTVCLNGFCNPLGLCGPIPQVGTWLCYKIPNHLSIIANSRVGFEGGKGVDMQDVIVHWGNPFTGASGFCVNASSADDTYLCSLGTLPQGIVVHLTPGLHPTQNGSTTWWACGNSSCIGSGELYINGQTVGMMANTIPTGLLSLMPSPPEVNRYGLHFITP